MHDSKLKIHRLTFLASRTGGCFVRYILPLLKTVTKNKLLVTSAINAVLSVLVTMVFAVQAVTLIGGSKYWWVKSEQIGVGGGTNFGYYRSLVESNLGLVIISLLGLMLLSYQTVKIFNQVRVEKWDKGSGRKGWLRLIGLLVYTAIVCVLLFLVA